MMKSDIEIIYEINQATEYLKTHKGANMGHDTELYLRHKIDWLTWVLNH